MVQQLHYNACAKMWLLLHLRLHREFQQEAETAGIKTNNQDEQMLTHLSPALRSLLHARAESLSLSALFHLFSLSLLLLGAVLV